MARLYRKVPVTVEALQNTPENREELFEFLKSGKVDYAYKDGMFWLETLEGNMRCKPGAWLVKAASGEMWPVQADIFEMTYVEVPFWED